ncbi:MAG TPA: glycogen debranching protein [Bryobacteraceae bacterium]
MISRTLALALWAAFHLTAQPQEIFRPLQAIPARSGSLKITQPAELHKPFSVAGPGGAVLGEQDGRFEAWLWPVKVLSHFTITAELADYSVPIDLSQQSAVVDVEPGLTTITYSHAAFTVRQRMFAPREGETGAVVLFEIESVRPVTLIFHFVPELQRMWPAPNFGSPRAEWVKKGYYILHTDDPAFSAAIAIPHTQPGMLAPYQERPHTRPLELRLAFDPQKDAGAAFPLLLVPGSDKTDYAAPLEALNASIGRLYAGTADYWAHFFDTRVTAETPDPKFDQALRWAEVAIEQGRIRFQNETGLAAGYYESGDSARPGYGWFFGRDALWTSFAINSYGDFGLTRQALEFLIHRQRPDGKIMHEISQTADLVNWESLPYFYAAADSTPLFVMAMADYVHASGDLAFLRTHWDAVRRAYAFTRAHDTDGDGIYDNSQGTGWVESWPPGMPHQEIYLAALDEQSAEAISEMARWMSDDSLAASARKQAESIRAAIESEYRRNNFYAFSRNADGTLDRTETVFPAVAWWTGTFALSKPTGVLDRWASPEFSTDWGTRDIGPTTPFYDPISYHQGSVWPLFTGWVSLAEYRAGRPLSALAHLMQNAGLTWTQDPGAITEVLSGAFFQPFGRSTSHQIWSSAMLLTPALRGLFGLDWDAPNHTLRLSPNLPATWNSALLHNVPLGGQRVDLQFTREGGYLTVRTHANVCLVQQTAPHEPCKAPGREFSIPLPAVELEIPHTYPLPGAATNQLKAVTEIRTEQLYEVVFEAPSGSQSDIPARLNRNGVAVTGAALAGDRLHVQFPKGSGYQRRIVRFSW